jgi:hypothetical protein
MDDRYTFRFRCGYQGCAWYDVHGDGPSYSVRVRRTADEYERKASSHTDEAWQRDVVGAIGLMVPDSGRNGPIAQAVVDAFNAWRDAEYWTLRRQIDNAPERYGVVDWDTNPVMLKPEPVRGAYYVVRWNRPEAPDAWKYGCVGLGWYINGEPSPALALTAD